MLLGVAPVQCSLTGTVVQQNYCSIGRAGGDTCHGVAACRGGVVFVVARKGVILSMRCPVV